MMIFHCNVRIANNKNKPFEVSVKNGLSYTPADMNDMTTKGRATSLAALEGFVSPDVYPENEPIPVHLRRGVDMNDAYEAEKGSRGKIGRMKKAVDQLGLKGGE